LLKLNYLSSGKEPAHGNGSSIRGGKESEEKIDLAMKLRERDKIIADMSQQIEQQQRRLDSMQQELNSSKMDCHNKSKTVEVECII
jgi:hypothetical protein